MVQGCPFHRAFFLSQLLPPLGSDRDLGNTVKRDVNYQGAGVFDGTTDGRVGSDATG